MPGLFLILGMKFGIVTFPGSNCDQDMILAIRRLGYTAIQLWHQDRDLQGVDCVILPGGFSYGDYLRSGAIARFSPVMEEIIQFAQTGGFVLGICNGFQILTEAGLLPGALLRNNSTRFISKNIFIRPEKGFISSNLADKAFCIPIAHGEGNFYCDPQTLETLENNQQIWFRYSDEQGNSTSEANPNGSLANIAGICNVNRTVFGMMPHPERASDEYLKNTDGTEILRAFATQINQSKSISR
jgi:phosphoribosylformylglycinamidine synthase subunit PurQ / glutaminase